MAQTLGLLQEHHTFGRSERLAWLVPLLFLALLAILRLSGGQEPREPQLLIWCFSSSYVILCGMAAMLAVRAVLAGAPRSILALGCGMGAVALSSMGAMLFTVLGQVNAAATVWNLGMLAAGLIHLMGAASMVRASEADPPDRAAAAKRLVLSSGMVMTAIAGLWAAAGAELLPPFIRFTTTTAFRVAILAATVAAYLVAALPFALLERQARSALLRWYWLGMMLVAMGVAGVAISPVASPTSWAGRCAVGVGFLYVLVGLYAQSHRGGDVALAAAFRDLEDALRESEGKYHALFTNSVDSILLTGEGGRIIAANPAACAVFGCSEAELQQVPLARLVENEPAGQLDAGELDRAATEARCSRRDGSPFDAEISSVPLRVSRRRFLIIRDISHRKRTAEALTRAKEAAETALREAEAARQVAETAHAEAKRANAAKDQFIAALSHELRTPLTPVLAAASSLKDDARLPEEVREDLQMIQRNVGLEVQLVADLLDVTRITNAKLVLDKRPLDVARVLRGAARICSTELDARNQRLTIHASGAPYFMSADEPRLHQVFWNLIKNASKFTPAGGAISIAAERRSTPQQGLFDLLCIKVTDTGCGIPQESLPRLFMAFEQGNTQVTRQFGGLGLGLAICKAVVEQHGGRIAADSPGPGLGATFTVELPLPSHCGDMVPSEWPGDRADAGACERAAPPMPLRILLVEDHLDTARIIQRLLRAQGHQVMVAGSVAESLSLARRHEFDLLLSDVGLPDGNGHDLLRQLTAEGRPMLAVALSGYGSAADVEESRAAGFCEHLTKPINVQSLRDALLRASGVLRA